MDSLLASVASLVNLAAISVILKHTHTYIYIYRSHTISQLTIATSITSGIMVASSNASPPPWSSRLVFGTYQQKGPELDAQVALALSKGFTSFDTASLYRNASALHAALLASPHPTLTTTKIHRADYPIALRARVRSCVSDLGSPTAVRSILLHRPLSPAYYSVLADEGRSMGVAVGVSNFTANDLRRLCAAYDPPTVNQIELHPFVPNLLTTIHECHKRSVVVEGHTVLAQGLFMSWPPLVEMASKLDATPAQVLLRFALQTVGEHGRVIVRSSNSFHLDELIAAASVIDSRKWTLSETQLAEMHGWALSATGAPKRFYIFPPMPPVTFVSSSEDIDEYVRDVATRMQLDIVIMEERELGVRAREISGLIFALPSGFSSQTIKSDKVSRMIASTMFPDSLDSMSDYIGALKRLRGAFLLQEKRVKNLERLCAKGKSPINDTQGISSHSLLSDDDRISLPVREPDAMPVKTAPKEDLVPFFHYLSSASASATPTNGPALFVRGCLFTDGRMDMCKQVVGSEHINALCDSVRASRASGKVRHFLLGNNVCCADDPEGGALALASLMKDPELPIETWYLAGNAINARAMSILGRSLEQNLFAKALWLKRNPLKAAGAIAVGNILVKSKSLSLLDLYNTGLLDDGIENLLLPLAAEDGLRLPLAHLYLGACGISQRGANAIAKFLRSSAARNLETLYLSMNRIGSNGANEIARSLCHLATETKRVPSLKRLSLASCRVTYDALPAIVDAAIACEMVCLDLGWYKATADIGERPNAFYSAAMKELLRLVRSVPSLRYLSVTRTGLEVNDILQLRSVSSKSNPRLWLEDGLKDNLRGGQTKKEIRAGVQHPKCVTNIDSIYRGKM